MQSLAIQSVQAMQAYSPPIDGRRAFNGTLLDFNERTIPPSDKVIKALEAFVRAQQTQLYPEYPDLCEKIASYSKVATDEVMITNGADQGIDLIFRTFTEKGDRVIIPSPSFAMFYQCAGVIGNVLERPSYSATTGEFPMEEVLTKAKQNPKLIVICNPNNPTGTFVQISDIEQILKNAPDTVVLVDEAYVEFAGESACRLISKYKNLMITRTFSKAFGLAGLRIGYVLSAKENVIEMKKVRGPYDINMAGYAAALAALDDIDYMRSYVAEVLEARKLVEDFFRKNRIMFYPSRANFILFKARENSNVACEKIKKSKILTRPRSEDMLRVSIGTISQMREFINIFTQLYL